MNIAIFGGAFNPITSAHLDIISMVLKLNIDKIFLEIAGDSYKNSRTSYIHRKEMVNLGIEKDNRIYIGIHDIDTDKELERNAYAIETLDWYNKYIVDSEDQLYYIIGSDQLKVFETWKEPEKLLKKYKWIVIARDIDYVSHIIDKSKLLSKYKNQIQNIPLGNMISSTLVRKFISELSTEDEKDSDFDFAISGILNDKVWAYIKENDLYEYSR